jgi:hypothetical protein
LAIIKIFGILEFISFVFLAISCGIDNPESWCHDVHPFISLIIAYLIPMMILWIIACFIDAVLEKIFR